jgi:class 3 adenylate cyclase
VAAGAFSEDRVAVTEALGAQAGIALENARLYGHVQSALETQKALTAANRRFVPYEFLEGLGRTSIVDVNLSEARERAMNVLFVDLRNFSALSMKLGPSLTVQMINRYLSHVQPGIAAHGGFVGQYYGDGVLALFPNESDGALLGAVAMCRGLDSYNRNRGEFPELQFGMGLHCGLLTLGTIGDPDHFQCSVMGDSVNLASRLEGLTSHFGSILVVSNAAVSRLTNPETFSLRSLGNVQVQGRNEVLQVYDCLNCYPDELRERLEKMKGRFEEARTAWTAGDFAAATAGFSECLRICPEDPVSRRFLGRFELMRDASSWDGIERPSKGKD